MKNKPWWKMKSISSAFLLYRKQEVLNVFNMLLPWKEEKEMLWRLVWRRTEKIIPMINGFEWCDKKVDGMTPQIFLDVMKYYNKVHQHRQMDVTAICHNWTSFFSSVLITVQSLIRFGNWFNAQNLLEILNFRFETFLI